VNPIDTYLRSGAYPTARIPFTPGFDCAGTVEAAGPGAAFEPGARVYTSSSISGAYAEFALCEAASVHPLPDNISFAQGAALGIPYATAYRALFHRAQARAGETVLVHGASGGVGTAAVQLARAAGMTVIGTSGTDTGRIAVLQNGAHHCLDHAATNYVQDLMALTQNRGVDVILEMLANVNLGKDLAMLAKSGRVVVIGSRGPVELNPRETMSRDASILGLMLFNASPADLKSIHAALFAGLANGTLVPIVGREFPLAEAPKAHEAVMAKGAHGKIVLLP
jgi:NADPH2:quinone reductase